MSGMSVLSTGFNLYSVFTASQQSRIEMPVLPSEAIYAQLQYVEGVPSEQGGVSLDRLRIIDSLIAQINAHRAAGTPPVKLDHASLVRPEAAVASLAHQAWEMQKAANPFRSWGSAAALVFDLHA